MRGAIQTGQCPSQPDEKKALNPPPERAKEKKKRASRGRSPQTVRENNPLPTTNDDRRAAPCGHFASLVRSTFGLRGYPPIFDLRRIPQRRSYRISPRRRRARRARSGRARPRQQRNVYSLQHLTKASASPPLATPPARCAEAKRREAAQTEGRAHERSEVTARGRALPASPRKGQSP